MKKAARTMTAILSLAGTLVAANAHASFLGNEIAYQIFSPNLSTPVSQQTVFTVGDGLEVSGFITAIDSVTTLLSADIDLSANTITADYAPLNFTGTFDVAEFNGSVFTDFNDTLPDIVSVTVDTGLTTFAFGPGDIFFNSDQIFINFSGLAVNTSSFMKLDVAFAPVPVPAAVWLFGSGLLGLVVMARRKQSV